jgi:hypothetical protein
MGGKMNIGELIDELLDFELSDEVSHLNLEITTGSLKWDLTKTSFGEFAKLVPDLGDDRGQNAANFGGIYTNTKRRRRGA